MKKSGSINILARLVLIAAFLIPFEVVASQEDQISQPVYVVQQGDTLWDISQRFRVSTTELVRANQMADASQLRAGDKLVIPGLEGIQGELITVQVPFGDSLNSFSRRYQAPVDVLRKVNRLTSPVEVYAGYNLIVPASSSETYNSRATLLPGQSLLELAVLNNANPWRIAADNFLQESWAALPGDVLLLPGDDPGPGSLPESISLVDINLATLAQGKTAVIRLEVQGEATLSGSLTGHELHFFQDAPNSYVALQGIHAMTLPGTYPLKIQGTLQDGLPFNFSQMIYIRDAGYLFEIVSGVDPATLDPANMKPEEELWSSLAEPVTPQRLWSGIFVFPSPKIFYDCWPSTYGRRRSYNGSEYKYFHTGLDVCGQVGTEIYAPAAGIVVFTGEQVVRGLATMIDHGWGIYSGIIHQSEFLVQVGDRVGPGQLIGLVGNTGRVTGPHLHWEVWAGGVQVDPMDWLAREHP